VSSEQLAPQGLADPFSSATPSAFWYCDGRLVTNTEEMRRQRQKYVALMSLF
jgi:hypothetical protein